MHIKYKKMYKKYIVWFIFNTICHDLKNHQVFTILKIKRIDKY